MFTGLVRATGRVQSLDARASARRLVIGASLPEPARALGASVAVDGVCLTVIASDAHHVAADVAFETLRCTTLADLSIGQRVNLEPALCLGDALGGHLVSGHVDGVSTLRQITPHGDARACRFDLEPELARFVASKGSICVSGVSLTVNHVGPDWFEVGLVPHTLAVTTLGEMRVGTRVNIEVDLLARYVARLAEYTPPSRGLSLQTLVDSGFYPKAST